jgi:hypothetical protein
MARYHILKDFKGSQDGRFTEAFQAGTEADLSDYLVSCLPADSIRAVEESPPADTAVPAKKSTKASKLTASPPPTVAGATGKE